MSDDLDDTPGTQYHPEETDLSLEREFAKAALGGMMPWAAQHQKNEFEVARLAWKFARAMVEVENDEAEAAPPPPPPRQPQRLPQRPVAVRRTGR